MNSTDLNRRDFLQVVGTAAGTCWMTSNSSSTWAAGSNDRTTSPVLEFKLESKKTYKDPFWDLQLDAVNIGSVFSPNNATGSLFFKRNIEMAESWGQNHAHWMQGPLSFCLHHSAILSPIRAPD